MHAALMIALLTACAPAPAAQAGAAVHAERIEAAKEAYEGELARYTAGVANVDQVGTWSARWYLAVHEAGDTSAASAHLARMEALSASVAQGVAAGAVPASDGAAARYFVAEAKVWSAR